MADVTISSLPLGTPSSSDVIPYSTGTATFRAPFSSLPGVPVGAVFHLATSTVPVGYLKCNGDTVPNGNGTVQGVTANFSALYTTLGSTYGALGKLPDLRGEFIRGFSDGRSGVDTGRTMGSNQLDAFQGHWHSTNDGYTGSTGSPYNKPFAGTGGDTFNPNFYARTVVSDGINGTPRTGTETRPRNVALMPVIKY